ncbi:MAG: hypothetical protein LBU24_03365 [Methanocalculaceae archaeon]|nr:hypothetical protein [Methanocalculaceae archaeon]
MTVTLVQPSAAGQLRCLPSCLRDIPTEEKDTAAMCVLPCRTKGASLQKRPASILQPAGFSDIYGQNLAGIRKNLCWWLEWYEKINPANSYYLISGTQQV